jgi:cell division protein FtsI (penicillin-binding protein 3)
LPKTVPIGLKPRTQIEAKPGGGSGRSRFLLTASLFVFAFAVLGARLVWLGLDATVDVAGDDEKTRSTAIHRPVIVDRKDRILASDIVTGSLFANPQQIVDLDDTVEQLTAVLPDIKPVALRRKLSGEGQFQWLARKLSPAQQAAVHELGLPGLYFEREPHRVYPAGASAAHILGHVDVDNKGLAGIETHIDSFPRIMRLDDEKWQGTGRVALAMDLSVQHAVREELLDALKRYKAKAAAALVLDIHSGEVVSLVSLPDYDPNRRDQALVKNRFNRITSGVFELGSVFKVFTTAMALDLGVTSLENGYDATEPIRIGNHTIRDFHAKKRWLSVPEIFIYSSNIGSAKMALDAGVKRHREFLKKLGLLERGSNELGPLAAPILPKPWRRINSMTIAFGHGLSVTPLQMAAGAATLLNGG